MELHVHPGNKLDASINKQGTVFAIAGSLNKLLKNLDGLI